jgi:hypothetical protein
MKLVRPLCALLLLALSSGTAAVRAQEPAEWARAPGQEVAQTRRYRLEMYKGKGHVFCEALLSTARRLHPKGEYRPLEPILRWKAIFSMPGVDEPSGAVFASTDSGGV